MLRPFAVAAGVGIAGAGCGDVVEADDAGPAGSADAGPAASADATPDAAAPPGPVWIVVDDVTTGLLVGPYAGSDVDAVDWACPAGGAGHGTAVNDRREGAPAATPAERALGPADGPCDPPAACAASLGAGGWVALAADVASLSGCEVTVHELADQAGEAFEVWVCRGPELGDGCEGPLFGGGDGATTRGTIP